MRKLGLALGVGYLLLLAGCQAPLEISNRSGPPIWPIWGGDPARTFCVPAMNLDTPPRPGWSREVFTIGGIVDLVADEQTVYLAVFVEGQNYQEQASRVLALRLADGKELWHHNCGQWGQPTERLPGACLALSGGRLFIVTKKEVAALDRQTGLEIWRKENELSNFETYLTLSDDRVIVYGPEKTLLAFRPADGERVWRADVSRIDGGLLFSSLLCNQGVVTIGPSYGSPIDFDQPNVAMVDAKDGRIRHRLTLGGRVQNWGATVGSAGIGGLAVCIGGRPAPGSRSISDITGVLLAVDQKSGESRWQRVVGPATGFGLASDGRWLFVPAVQFPAKDAGIDALSKGFIIALDAAADRQIWRTQVGTGRFDEHQNLSPIRSIPILCGGTLLVRAGETELCALDAGNGNLLWRQTIRKEAKENQNGGQDHIIVAGGRIIYTTGGTISTLIAAGKAQGPPGKPATQP